LLSVEERGESENIEQSKGQEKEAGLIIYACGANNVYMIDPRHRSNSEFTIFSAQNIR